MPGSAPRSRALFTWLLAIVLLGALTYGLEQITYAPLQTGERYPAFSTLRPDPDGALALYESLAALPQLRVDRLYKERRKLDPDETMLVLGIDPVAWSLVDEADLKQYEKIVQDGGRLVFGFLPTRTPGDLRQETPRFVGRWHIELKYRPEMNDYSSGGIPRDTALYFDTHLFAQDTFWRALRQSGGKTEALERTFGKGTIVLAADTFALSNQGLRDHRDAEFIATLVGAATHITFDENHFGVVESGSLVKLMRRYRLQGAIAVLLVMAMLFLWRAASSFLPPRSSSSSKSSVAGRDSLAGLASLLNRGVSEKQLLETCFAEWRKSAPRERRADAMQRAIAAHSGSPVDAYKAACRILTEHT